jgi:hypothetical protein
LDTICGDETGSKPARIDCHCTCPADQQHSDAHKPGKELVHYLRHRLFFVIIASHGVHPFFAAGAKNLGDIRQQPISFQGYSIGCQRARGGGDYHASVRINQDRFAELKGRFQDVADRRTMEELCSDLQHLPCEAYAPVRFQLGGLFRFINRRRKLAALNNVN